MTACLSDGLRQADNVPDGGFDDNGNAIGDETYLTQVELADYLPATIVEGTAFSVSIRLWLQPPQFTGRAVQVTCLFFALGRRTSKCPFHIGFALNLGFLGRTGAAQLLCL